MKIDVLTIFPEMFSSVTQESIIGRANKSGILEINLVNIRDFSNDKHNKVDDSPFGGGAGMVMKAEPFFCALDSINAKGKRIIYLSPKGKILDQEKVTELSLMKEIILLCGHYEGIDERIIEHWDIEEISVGDYILTGGEIPAMILIDSVARMIPGVLGSNESHLEESIYSGLLEYPQYTKPREYSGLDVPEVLISGNHENIQLWKFEQSLLITKKRRPDLFEKYLSLDKFLTKKEHKILERILKD
ncbi:MAG: tRNA (guanosine(37)-N1)-methyltransferase TrmD [Eubacteriales bacterium]